MRYSNENSKKKCHGTTTDSNLRLTQTQSVDFVTSIILHYNKSVEAKNLNFNTKCWRMTPHTCSNYGNFYQRQWCAKIHIENTCIHIHEGIHTSSDLALCIDWMHTHMHTYIYMRVHILPYMYTEYIHTHIHTYIHTITFQDTTFSYNRTCFRASSRILPWIGWQVTLTMQEDPVESPPLHHCV